MLKEEMPTSNSPPGFVIDIDLLQQFETELDPLNPDRGNIPCRVLGYGEISTAFEIDKDSMHGLAFKRMSVFETYEELNSYIQAFHMYNHLLETQVGIHLPSQGYAIVSGRANRPVFYIIQEKAPGFAIGNQVIHSLPLEETLHLVRTVLHELLRTFQFNRDNISYQVGLDGQISNWIVIGYDPENPHLPIEITLAYLDNSTPLFRRDGIEQMDAELFLRPAPAFLAWILRRFFLEDVVDRYYDFRKVIIDLLANFFKEQKAEIIPALVQETNDFIQQEAYHFDLQLITEKEIYAYYREDSFIWRLYLAMRHVDRILHNLSGRYYPYILPGKINR